MHFYQAGESSVMLIDESATITFSSSGPSIIPRSENAPRQTMTTPDSALLKNE